MKIYGIVMEANPFHNGHQYFINKIKEQYNADIIISITSTSFQQQFLLYQFFQFLQQYFRGQSFALL